MFTLAVIHNNSVTNVVVWDGKSDISFLGETLVIDTQNPIGIGWTKIDGVWTAPVEPEP